MPPYVRLKLFSTLAIALSVGLPQMIRAESTSQSISLRGWTVKELTANQSATVTLDAAASPEVLRVDYQSPKLAGIVLAPPDRVQLPDGIRDLSLWFARAEGDFTLAFQIRDASGALHEIKTPTSRMRDAGMVGWQPARVREWSMWTQARSHRINVSADISERVLAEFQDATRAKVWATPLELAGIIIKPASAPAFDASSLGGAKTAEAVKSGNGSLFVADLVAHTKNKLEADSAWYFYARSRTGRETPPAVFLDDMTDWSAGIASYEVIVRRGYQGSVVWRATGKGSADRKNPAALFRSRVVLPQLPQGRYFLDTKAWRPDGTLLEERQFLHLLVTRNDGETPAFPKPDEAPLFQIHTGMTSHVFPPETEQVKLDISVPATRGADGVRIKIVDFYNRVLLQEKLPLPSPSESSLVVSLPVKAGGEYFAEAELRDEKNGRNLDKTVLHFGVANRPESSRGDIPAGVPDRDTVLNGQFHFSAESWDGDRSSSSFPWTAWDAPDARDFEKFCEQAVRAGAKSINLNDLWGSHEMLPGVYQWQELDRLIDRAAAHGLKVFLAYTVGTRRSRFDFPLWLDAVPRVDQAGDIEGLERGMYWPSWWDDAAREGWLRYYHRLVEHVRTNPNVIGYRLSNYQLSGFTAGWGADPMRLEYSKPAQREFARWAAGDEGKRFGVSRPGALFYVPGTPENQVSGPDLSPDWQSFVAFSTHSHHSRLTDFFTTIRSLDKRRQIQVDQKPFPWAMERSIPLLRDGGVLKNEDSPTFSAAALRSMSRQAGVPYAEEFHGHFPTSRAIADATNFWHSYLSDTIFWLARWETMRMISVKEAEKKGGWENVKLSGQMAPETMLDFARDAQPAWERWLRADEAAPQVLVFGSRAAEMLGNWKTGNDYGIAGMREFSALFQQHQIPVHFADEYATWSQLGRFKTVFVCGEIMTEEAIARIVTHVRDGGKIVVVGNAGKYCPQRPAERDVLKAELEKLAADHGSQIRRIADLRRVVETGIPEWLAAFRFDESALAEILKWAGVAQRISVTSDDTDAHGGAGARFECQLRTGKDSNLLVAVLRKWPGGYMKIEHDHALRKQYGVAAGRVQVREIKDGAWRVETFHREKKVLGIFQAKDGVLSFDTGSLEAGEAVLFSLSPATEAAPYAKVVWDFDALQKPPRVFDAPSAYFDALAKTGEILARRGAQPEPSYLEPTKPAAEAPKPQTEPLPEGIRAFSFEGLPFKGKPTRVFAFYGAPSWASPTKKAPGIVLIHGAGGTAFASWVKTWVDRGYAAIAFDHDGGIPVGKYNLWMRSPDSPGPKRGGMTEPNTVVSDHSMYHGVADTILAHSLLASFPEVDAARIGATGISHGAVILANTVGVDTRLKFAVPVYGCGYIARNENEELWDSKYRLPSAKVPMLWLNGTNDFAFAMNVWQNSYRTAPGTQAICARVRMVHGHGAAGENPEEIRAFADSLVNGGKPLARVVRQSPDQGDKTGRVWVEWETDAELPIQKAQINFTRTAEGRWKDRVWETAPAEIDAATRRATATLPADAAVYYFNLIDVRGLIVSSEHATRK